MEAAARHPSILKEVTPLADGGVEMTIQNGLKGRTAQQYFDGIEAGAATVDRLWITFAYTLDEFTFALHPHANAPSDVDAFEGAALGYLTVDREVQNGYFEAVGLRFEVPKSELPAGASPDDVALYRYDGNSWSKLETSRSGSTYTATAPGFSVFAVGVDSGEPSLAVTGAELSATEIAPGESVDVTATVTNDGDEKGSAELALEVDGETVATKSVTVGAGESKTVTFTRAFDEAGDYEIVVEDVTAGTLSVQADGTATPGPGTDEPGDDGGGTDWTTILALVALLVLAVAVVYLYREGYFDGLLGRE